MVLAMHINRKPKHGGSVFGRQKICRERIDAQNRLMRNYFAQIPIYPESYFRRRFRMSIELFKHIAEKLASHDRVFQQRRNATGELGHNAFQKVIAALRMLAYDIPADCDAPRPELQMPSRVSGFRRVICLVHCISSLHHVHCIMSSCHYYCNHFKTLLNKSYGSSIHLNRGKDDFSL